MILAIDTATRFASIALYDAHGLWAEHTWHSHNNHTVELAPNLQRLLEGQGVKPQQLDGIVVAIGPGSFTGLRVGVTMAKGLAMAANLPLVGVPTLDVVAYAHTDRGLPLWAVLQAGRKRVCAAFYAPDAPPPATEDYLLTTLDALTPEGWDRVLYVGEISPQAAQDLKARWGERVVVASPAAGLRRAGYLAELGWQRLKAGDTDDPASLSPIYLRSPGIDA